MPLRIGEGDFVEDRIVLGTAGLYRVTRCLQREYRNSEKDGGQRICWLHRRLAPVGCGTDSPSFLRSFSHRPSKLPFDMIRSRSPGLASPARYSAILSAPSKASASLPSSRTL